MRLSPVEGQGKQKINNHAATEGHRLPLKTQILDIGRARIQRLPKEHCFEKAQFQLRPKLKRERVHACLKQACLRQ
jgi:hypothetical protein